MSKIIDSTDKGAAINESENDSNLSTLAGINVVDSTNSRTVDIDDQGATIEFTFAGAVAVTLDDIATIAGVLHTDDFTVTLIATGASTVVTITPDGSDSINTGAATIVLTTDEYVTLQTDSTGAIWNIINSSGITSVIRDLNGNESIVIVTSTNAVNALGVTNSATTDPVILAPLGDDADIQLNLSPKGNDSVFLRATGSGNSVVSSNTGNSIVSSDSGDVSVDAVAGGVTIDAGSGNVALIASGSVTTDDLTATTTNGDLSLSGNGTGSVLIGNKTARGIEFLANPEKLLDISLIGHRGTSGVFTSSSGFASTTLSDASATAAIVRVYYRLSWTSDADVWSYFSVRKAGESDGASTVAIAGQRGTHASAAGTNQVYVIGEGTVPLDTSSDFEYTFSFNSSASLAEAGGIYLIGYYV